MSRTLRLPKNAVSEFDLPRVCVATGETEGVSYQKVTFTFVPLWARLSVGFCGIIGIILMIVNTKKVEAEIPFTDAAFRTFKVARIVPLALILGAVALMVVPIVIDPELVLFSIVVFVAGLVAAIIYIQAVTRPSGPMVKEIDDEFITLEIPNDEAARAIEERVLGD
jgi:hypothetical protein